MSWLAAIALGSNLDSQFGDREANLREAVSRIGQLGVVKGVSSFYDTEPVGYREQPRFLNGALLGFCGVQFAGEGSGGFFELFEEIGGDRKQVAAGKLEDLFLIAE